MAKVLVMGASGSLGSHVVKELCAAGRTVRIMVRASSDTRTTDHLPLERVIGELGDGESIAAAMAGCDAVYYCIVDTRAWLRDPAPLYATNVDGLRWVLDIALRFPLQKFVFTSTFATIGLNASGVSTEADAFNWRSRAPHYVKCRVEAEEMFLRYCRDKGLPGVACCVANTYGADDVAPTPHGKMVQDVALGKMPYYWDGGGPCVGIRDAARALLLAETRGRTGERYIVAERWLDYQELFAIAASAAGVAPPGRKIPLPVLYAMAGIADLTSIFTRKDNRLSIASLRCSTLLPNVDCAKARQELGWQPAPVEKEVAEAVAYYLSG
ncbi:MAG: NAD-dependent epimerase/dehydratase family protein [Halioglobus sp.]|nr:NAD-dependent epimerase/dehydratase family protein [Halioglobus sp.]